MIFFILDWIGLDQCFSTIPPEEIDAWGSYPSFIDALFIDFCFDGVLVYNIVN